MTTHDLAARRPYLNPFNAVLGLAFLALAGGWAARESDLVDPTDLGRAAAIGLIVLGVLGVVATLAVSRRRPDRSSGPTDPADTDPAPTASESATSVDLPSTDPAADDTAPIPTGTEEDHR